MGGRVWEAVRTGRYEARSGPVTAAADPLRFPFEILLAGASVVLFAAVAAMLIRAAVAPPGSRRRRRSR